MFAQLGRPWHETRAALQRGTLESTVSFDLAGRAGFLAAFLTPASFSAFSAAPILLDQGARCSTQA